MKNLKQVQEEFRRLKSIEGVSCSDCFLQGFDAFRDSPEYQAMKAALEFYKNRENWIGLDGVEFLISDHGKFRINPHGECGKKAREVLAAIEGEK